MVLPVTWGSRNQCLCLVVVALPECGMRWEGDLRSEPNDCFKVVRPSRAEATLRQRKKVSPGRNQSCPVSVLNKLAALLAPHLRRFLRA